MSLARPGQGLGAAPIDKADVFEFMHVPSPTWMAGFVSALLCSVHREKN